MKDQNSGNRVELNNADVLASGKVAADGRLYVGKEFAGKSVRYALSVVAVEAAESADETEVEA